ncbi:MAG: DUF983 domain-containing protein [Pseudomonadota bacterium]
MAVEYISNPPRNLTQSLLRGMKGRCPNCGKGSLFTKYLKVAHSCSHCGEELHHHRADDAPPYFTILINGHLIVPPVLAIEMAYQPSFLLQAAVWIPVTIATSLAALPVVKGALVNYQWALYMHGFDPAEREG